MCDSVINRLAAIVAVIGRLSGSDFTLKGTLSVSIDLPPFITPKLRKLIAVLTLP
jgi:hypothetical protein